MPGKVWTSAKRRRARSAAAVLAAIGFAAPAQPSLAAADADVLDRLKALEQLIETQQRQIEAQQRQINQERAEINALKTQLQASEPAVAEAPKPPAQAERQIADAKPTAPEPQMAEATFERGRPTVTSRDRRYSLSVIGRLQFDAAGYFQDEAGPLSTDWRRGSIGNDTRENIAATDLSNGTNFRRAQLGIEGELGRRFRYRLLPEFGGTGEETNPRMHEAWLSYTGLTPWTIKLGAFPPPANLDDSSGADETPFLERATPAQLSRALAGSDGRVSAGLTGNRQRWFAAFHLTGSTFSADESFDEQIGVVGRAAVLAFTGSDFNVHLGVNGSYVMQPTNTGGGATSARYIRFRDQPELRVDSTRLIDTGSILAENAYAAGVEFAANWRNFMIQAEAFRYGIGLANDTTNEDPHFSAWYAEGSYVLAGERRAYDIATGSYGAPRPIMAPDGAALRGALELAARYSHTDLNFHAGTPGLPPPPGGIRGGVQDNLSVGLNWYPTANIKFMFDYQHISVDRLNPASPTDPEPFGTGDATPPIGVQIGQTLHALAVRTQYSF